MVLSVVEGVVLSVVEGVVLSVVEGVVLCEAEVTFVVIVVVSVGFVVGLGNLHRRLLPIRHAKKP